jgi:hypothetical protein
VPKYTCSVVVEVTDNTMHSGHRSFMIATEIDAPDDVEATQRFRNSLTFGLHVLYRNADLKVALKEGESQPELYRIVGWQSLIEGMLFGKTYRVNVKKTDLMWEIADLQKDFPPQTGFRFGGMLMSQVPEGDKKHEEETVDTESGAPSASDADAGPAQENVPHG